MKRLLLFINLYNRYNINNNIIDIKTRYKINNNIIDEIL